MVDKGEDWFAVDVSGETVSRTASDHWREGAKLNLERSLRLGDELGGHIVTGHVDTIGEVTAVGPDGDSTRIEIRVPRQLGPMVAPKGSITLDGVSLTVNTVEDVGESAPFHRQHHPPHGAANNPWAKRGWTTAECGRWTSLRGTLTGCWPLAHSRNIAVPTFHHTVM